MFKEVIHTDRPLCQQREKITQKIADFWDQISEGWRVIWGHHIHHGFYENNEMINPKEAQVKLIEKLAANLHIKPQDKILDVGCGMGGSSLFLAKHHPVWVTGITLSHKQVAIATQLAKEEGVSRVNFKIDDALSLKTIEDNSFDIIWCLESCEQYFDKKLFLKHAYRVLKPGGQLMLATWCSDRDIYENKSAKDYQKLCHAFDLPYMPTMDYYRKILLEQQFLIHLSEDWSSQVKKSWDIGVSLLNAYSFLKLLKMGGLRGVRFAGQIKLMQKAFHQNRIHYGVFLALKPNQFTNSE